MSASGSIKVAAITDDGATISQHFGRATQYLVVSIENGAIIGRELRAKTGHVHLANEPHHDHDHQPGQGHGMDPASHDRHLQMTEPIQDCQALLCRGMGRGAYESVKARGIQPILTDIADIEQAIKAYLAGTIIDMVERLH